MPFSEFLSVYAAGFGVIMVFMALIWLLSLARKDASVVDVFWGMCSVVLALAYFALTPNGYGPRKLLITVLYTLWGLRLSGYIFWRNVLGKKGEDYRYRRMRENVGPPFWWRSLFTVFLLQGLFIWLLSSVSLVAQINPMPDSLTVLDVLGALIWAVGFTFEAVGDLQLARFKADPANQGRLMNQGLWGLTRHPNYFGDATAWWGYFVIALGTPGGILTVYSPAIMTFLLVRVSGVGLLEKDLVKSKPGYEEYIRSVPAFLPRLPGRRS